MYYLNWTENDIEDLHDEFWINTEEEFWDFIREEVDTAFYLGFNFKKWMSEISTEKQILYSIGARHIFDDLVEYQSQIVFWSNKFTDLSKTEDIDIIEMSEYILNNMIFQKDDEDLIVNLAFHLGINAGKLIEKEESKDNKISIEFKPE